MSTPNPFVQIECYQDTGEFSRGIRTPDKIWINSSNIDSIERMWGLHKEGSFTIIKMRGGTSYIAVGLVDDVVALFG